MRKLPLAVLTFLFLSLTPINFVLAHEEGSSGSTETEIEHKRLEIKQNMEERKKEAKDRFASKSAERKEKLEANKERICEKRKGNIVNRANKVETRIEKHFNRFGEIVTKVDAFYTRKLVSKGVIVSNYDLLKEDINTQKTEVESLITKLKVDIAAFDCAGNNPKSQLETIKADFKNVHEAMKDYRTSIVNFIQAIKQAVAEKKSATSSADADLD